MPAVETIMQIVVSASAIIAAAAAVGIYHRVDHLVTTVDKHDRTLYGADDVAEWSGLVERVAAHEAELERRRDEEGDE